MKISIYILIVCAVLLFLSYLRVVYIIKTNELPVIKQTTNVFGQGPELIYVAAGDSTAVGVGASRVEQTYTYQIASKLSQTNKIQYHNFGISGARTQDFIDTQLPKIIKLNPDIVTISIGANDVTHLQSTTSTLHNLKIIIQALQNQTHAQIYVANMPILKDAPLLPLLFRKFIEINIKTINSELAKLANERTKIVPIHDYGWSNFSDLKVTFAQDQFHPSDLGYQNWAKAFLTTMNLN